MRFLQGGAGRANKRDEGKSQRFPPQRDGQSAASEGQEGLHPTAGCRGRRAEGEVEG